MAARGWYRRYGKRVVDVVLGCLVLVVLFPLALLVALLVRFTMGSPVLFRQVRPGLHGRPFVMYKFRTMTDRRDAKGALLPDGERLTRVGRVLRKLSLDEIPELWNVLRGDMSLVGPRPLLMEYLPLYTPEQARRQEVRPGMAGPVIMSGRNLLSWEEKFKLDVWYVDHVSVRTDLVILVRTFIRVLAGKGVSGPGEATVAKFQGRGG